MFIFYESNKERFYRQVTSKDLGGVSFGYEEVAKAVSEINESMSEVKRDYMGRNARSRIRMRDDSVKLSS